MFNEDKLFCSVGSSAACVVLRCPYLLPGRCHHLSSLTKCVEPKGVQPKCVQPKGASTKHSSSLCPLNTTKLLNYLPVLACEIVHSTQWDLQKFG